MNKIDYLEILNDYLSRCNASEEEKLDIVRDIEEMISEGLSSGKSEYEIINDLGSPKKIVAEMLQIDIDAESEPVKGDTLNQTIDNEIKKTYKKITEKPIKHKAIRRIINTLKRLGKIMWASFLYLFGSCGAIATTGLAIIACLGVIASLLMTSVHMPIAIGGIFASLFFVGAVFVGYECTIGVFECATTLIKGKNKSKEATVVNKDEEKIKISKTENDKNKQTGEIRDLAATESKEVKTALLEEKVELVEAEIVEVKDEH